MPELICPVCGGVLRRENRSLLCARRHCYDIAKQNYVNLLQNRAQSSKRHGDDAAMIAARHRFLDGGWYAPLRDALCDMALQYTGEHVDFLDAGCGEGWYTDGITRALRGDGRACDTVGIDISRDAVIAAAKRGDNLSLAVASAASLPVGDGSCDLVLSCFAPDEPGEFLRVLRPGGVLLRVVPLEEHLMELKAAVYDVPRPNPPAVYAPQGFRQEERREVRGTIALRSAQEIGDLFLMTPYYYKTGRDDQAKLAQLSSLDVTLAFGIFAERKI